MPLYTDVHRDVDASIEGVEDARSHVVALGGVRRV